MGCRGVTAGVGESKIDHTQVLILISLQCELNQILVIYLTVCSSVL